MAFCGNCGHKYEEGTKFCPGCGAALAAPAQPEAAPPPPPQQPAAPANDFGAKLQSLNNTADSTSAFDPADIQQNKAMGILAYLGILVLIPIFACKGSRFARFHSNQGLVLLLACVAYNIVYGIINAILLAISWRLAFIGTILSLVGIVFLVLAIIGIVNVCNGRAKELPLIGKIKLLK